MSVKVGLFVRYHVTEVLNGECLFRGEHWRQVRHVCSQCMCCSMQCDVAGSFGCQEFSTRIVERQCGPKASVPSLQSCRWIFGTMCVENA